MSTEEKMTIDERYKYLRRRKKRYVEAGRQGRSQLLDEMEEITGLNRKTLIRLLKRDLQRKPRVKQRGRSYGAEVDDALRVIAETLDYICAERMKPYLVRTAQDLSAHGEWDVSPHLLGQLAQISISSVRRHLQRLRQDEPHLPRKGPERANQATKDVPMTRIPWNESSFGNWVANAVHHGGSSASVLYVHIVQTVQYGRAQHTEGADRPLGMQ
jgi:hypothetical protein